MAMLKNIKEVEAFVSSLRPYERLTSCWMQEKTDTGRCYLHQLAGLELAVSGPERFMYFWTTRFEEGAYNYNSRQDFYNVSWRVFDEKPTDEELALPWGTDPFKGNTIDPFKA